MNKNIGPDPLEICPINPLDFRMEGDKFILDPGWWKKDKDKEKPIAKPTERR